MWMPEWLREQRPNLIFVLLAAVWGGSVTATNFLIEGATFWQKTGLFTMIGLLFAWAAVATYLARKKRPSVTVDNVEAKIKEWLPLFGHAYKPIYSNQEVIFGLEVTLSSGTHQVIHRSKRFDEYITIQIQIGVEGEAITLWRELSEDKVAALKSRVRIALAQSKIAFKEELPDALLIVKPIPITAELNEQTLFRAMEEVEMAQILATEIVTGSIRRST